MSFHFQYDVMNVKCVCCASPPPTTKRHLSGGLVWEGVLIFHPPIWWFSMRGSWYSPHPLGLGFRKLVWELVFIFHPSIRKLVWEGVLGFPLPHLLPMCATWGYHSHVPVLLICLARYWLSHDMSFQLITFLSLREEMTAQHKEWFQGIDLLDIVPAYSIMHYCLSIQLPQPVIIICTTSKHTSTTSVPCT